MAPALISITLVMTPNFEPYDEEEDATFGCDLNIGEIDELSDEMKRVIRGMVLEKVLSITMVDGMIHLEIAYPVDKLGELQEYLETLDPGIGGPDTWMEGDLTITYEGFKGELIPWIKYAIINYGKEV